MLLLRKHGQLLFNTAWQWQVSWLVTFLLTFPFTGVNSGKNTVQKFLRYLQLRNSSRFTRDSLLISLYPKEPLAG